MEEKFSFDEQQSIMNGETTPEDIIVERRWAIWTNEWNNARKFFISKGNIKTKARLKKKWMDDFFEIIDNKND